MEGLPGRVISPMPGPPQRQHKHETQYTPSTHYQAHTQSSQQGECGMMITTAKWYSGTLGGLKFPDICLTVEEKPPQKKTLTQETCPDRWSNPGPLRDKRACYHLLHSGGQKKYNQSNLIIVKSILEIIIHILKLLHKNVECFTSEPNAHGIFWNLHIKSNLKINTSETNESIELKFFILSIFRI